MKTFITLIPQIIAFIASIITIGWSSRVALQKERRQLLWSKELERFFALEELAGQITEELASYRQLDFSSTIAPKMEELSRAAGRFSRYDQVHRAIVQLQITLLRFRESADHSVDHGDTIDSELRAELNRDLKDLFKACDEVTERHKLG